MNFLSNWSNFGIVIFVMVVAPVVAIAETGIFFAIETIIEKWNTPKERKLQIKINKLEKEKDELEKGYK